MELSEILQIDIQASEAITHISRREFVSVFRMVKPCRISRLPRTLRCISSDFTLVLNGIVWAVALFC